MTISQGKYWCFTFNNYTVYQSETIETYFQEHGYKYIMGKEVGESGTPHLQGYIEHEKRFRPSELKFQCCEWSDLHWEKRKGKSEQASAYCAKDGDYVTNMNIRRPCKKITRAMMRANQLAVADKYLEPEDPIFGRQIHWYWEVQGGWGKSVLTKFMVDQMNAIVIGGAKEGDIYCGVTAALEKADVPIVIVDVPRHGRVCYRAIEKVKDGCFFNTKYESSMVRFNSPHVIVFSNSPPDQEQFSADRWVVTNL